MASDTVTFVETYLNTTYPGIKINKLDETAGSKPGDNIGGVLKAIKVEAVVYSEEKVFNIVCKSSSDDPFVAALLNESGAFKREVEMYTKVLPSFVKFQEENGITDPVKIHLPAFYHSSVGEGALDRILLEDMRASGYKMADKFVGLNLEETKLALTEIGKLHGMSYAMKVLKKKPLHEIFPCLSFGVIDFFAEEIRNNYREAVAYVHEIGEHDVAERMKKYFGKEIEWVKTTAVSDPNNPLTVTTHSDFWLNNMLFKYDENDTPVDISVIDFQFCSAAHIMWDVMYFLFTSTSRENRKLHLTTWLQCYHKLFLSVIKKFPNLDPPENYEFSDFEKLFHSFLPYGILHTCYAIAFQHSDGAVLKEAMCIVEPPDSEDHGATAARMLLRSGQVKEKLMAFLNEMVEIGAL